MFLSSKILEWRPKRTLLSGMIRKLEFFLRICIKEIDARNRPWTPFSKERWNNLEKKFQERIRCAYDRIQLKNKQVSQPSLLRVSETRLTGASWTGEKCAESPPTFIERKTLEKPKETGHKEYSRFGSYIYAWGRY